MNLEDAGNYLLLVIILLWCLAVPMISMMEYLFLGPDDILLRIVENVSEAALFTAGAVFSWGLFNYALYHTHPRKGEEGDENRNQK